MMLLGKYVFFTYSGKKRWLLSKELAPTHILQVVPKRSENTVPIVFVS